MTFPRATPPLVHVTDVEPLDGFVLRLTFDDGATIDRDLTEYLRGGVFQPLRDDSELFRQVVVDKQLGTIVWPNGADMDPVVLRGLGEPAWKTDEADEEEALRLASEVVHEVRRGTSR